MEQESSAYLKQEASVSRRLRAWLMIAAVLLAGGAAPAQTAKDRASTAFRPRDYTAHLIGHAHIDLAWLWRWEETVHDIATNTFRGTLEQMDRMPGLTFAQSQPAVYEAIEKNYPDLFEKIRDKVKAGTWAPVGGMWSEPDLNMPDGESLAHQLLYGKRYFLDKFGVDVTVGWNPDSFGHNFQLPQILSRAGIRSYVFGRCGPKDTTIFVWEGMDGSRVIGYVTPGFYSVDLKNGVKGLIAEAARTTTVKDFMILYGAGDHGGGPRHEDLQAIYKYRDDKTEPRLEFVRPDRYFQMLEPLKSALPVFKQELNFIFPACYTTQADEKKNNRRLENLLAAAEKFSAVAAFGEFRPYYPERDLDEAWKIVLRNQFHDILDGSGIAPVYEEARRYYREARERGGRALDFSLEEIANAIDTRGEGRPLVVFNSLAWSRTDPVEADLSFPEPVAGLKILDDQGKDVAYQITRESERGAGWQGRVLFIARNVPSLGYRTYRVFKTEKAPEFPSPLTVGPAVLENEFLKASLDARRGWISSLTDKRSGRECLAAPANVLQAIADEPKLMSAWELGLGRTLAALGEDGASLEVVERGPVRATVRVKTGFRDSAFSQDLSLYVGIPRLDCRLQMNWQERNVMIKAAFPAAVRSARADFEIPYGFITRPADGNEVPAIRWLDLTDESGAFGLSLLNDSKYGFDVKDNVIRISLVHGPTDPDPEADRGESETIYSLYPHTGGWQQAQTFRRAGELNQPLLARLALNHPGTLGAANSFARVEPENVVLSTMKKEMGYYNYGLIFRVYETFGRETDAVIEFPWDLRFEETDLIERPSAKIQEEGRVLHLKLKPFEIKTIRATKKSREG
jgi:alpha-mannosidase